MKWERAKGYGDILEILNNHKVIPFDFVERVKPIASLRKILVHAYLSIDRDILYRNLEKKDDFKEFERFILEFVQKDEA